MAPPTESSVTQKVQQYEEFISSVLHRDLRKVLDHRDQINEKISQYVQLKNTIHSLQEAGPQQLQTEVDLGCHFLVQAEIPDSSQIFVSVGFGVFLQMSHDEALRFVDKRTNQLTAFTEQLTKESAKIKAHIRLTLEALRELQGFSDSPPADGRPDVSSC